MLPSPVDSAENLQAYRAKDSYEKRLSILCDVHVSGRSAKGAEHLDFFEYLSGRIQLENDELRFAR